MTRRFTFTQGSSSKFWEGSRDGKSMTARWGRIGSDGQSKTRSFDSADEAEKALAKVIRQKVSEGYLEEGSTRPKPTADASAGAHKAVALKGARSSKAADKPRARLKQAFKALNERGIVALENAGYTMSDGWGDVNELATARAASGNRPRGATFYHGQDRERAKRGEGLFLAYGAYVEGKEHDRASLAIAREIVEVLVENGFKPVWDGTLQQRIHTGRFEWS